MAGTYSEFLVLNVLNEGQTVSYRSLSRALKVHSNLAKQMLYDFHRSQTNKTPGSLHATYLLTGKQQVQRQSSQMNGISATEDIQSSPLPASSAPEAQTTWIKVLSLVKEEQLAEAKANFDELLSIHIYSLEPGTINDLEVLTECNRKVAVDFASEDPLEFWKQYGTIQNSNVKRRTGRRPPPPAAATTKNVKPATTPSLKQETSSKSVDERRNTTKPLNASEPTAAKPTSKVEPASAASSQASSTAKPPTIKREVSSIFKSFAKAKPKLQQPTTETASQSSAAETPVETPIEDDLMGGLSDEEAGEEDAAMLDEGALDQPTGKSKREREEELRLMMEADDEPMEDAPVEPVGSATATNQEDSQSKEEPEPIETLTVSDGRRRGRRRVMKKKTVKDEEGYLVTKEELAWESFSEDEPASKKSKLSAPPPTAAKGKKASNNKAGQGSIMSFFKKT